jgi:CheY-like chemotaxis protein
MSSSPPINTASAIAAANDVAGEPSPVQWTEIVQQLGAEIAGPLSLALERIHDLVSTGQIDRQNLRALRESVSQAREAGMLGQQLARLASGRLKLTRERMHLTQVLRGVLAQRSRETQARGIQVRQILKPVEIMADGSLLFALLNALMDWALASTHSSIDLRLDLTPWPAKARLVCRFAHRSLDLIDDPRSTELPKALNSLAWRLVEQTALTMGVLPLREDEAGISVLTLEFPQTVSDEPGPAPNPIMSDRDVQRAGPTPAKHSNDHAREYLPSSNSKPLAGSHILIVSQQRELRSQIQAAVQHMGLIVDLAGSMAEATQFCQDGLPHGIVFESGLRGDDFDLLFADVMREVPDFCFVEVLNGQQLTQLSTATADGLARVSRQHLDDALASVLMFELSKGL